MKSSGVLAEVLVLTVASTLIYTKALFNNHTMDDHPGIEWNHVVLGNKGPLMKVLFSTDFWGQDLNMSASHGSFRPLATALFRLQAVVTATFQGKANEPIAPHPSLLHAVNIFFHWLTTLVLFCLFSISCGTKEITNLNGLKFSVPFVASLLFALHPIHTEAVCGGVGQAEVICSFLMFAAASLYYNSILSSETKETQIGTAIGVTALAILAAATKEQGFMTLPMCFLIELIFIGSPHLSTFRLTYCILGSASLGAIRLYLFGSPKSALFLPFDNPASFEPFPIRHLTFAYLPLCCLSLLIYPLHLCADWGDGAVSLVKSVGDIRFLLAAFTYLALAVRIAKKLKPPIVCVLRRIEPQVDRQLLLAIAIFAATFLPSSNFLGPVGFAVAERVLYAPSAGVCLLIAVGFQRLFSDDKVKPKMVLNVILLITCLFFGVRTVLRTYDWESDLALSYGNLRSTEANGRVFVNVGAYVRETTKDLHRALAYFDKGCRLNKNMAKAHFNKARCLRAMIEQRSEEVAALKSGKPTKPPKGEPHLYHVAKACDLALRRCTAAAKHNIPPNGFVPNHLVECYLDRANLMTVHGPLYLGSLAQSQQIADEAMILCDKAQEMRPDLPRVYVTRANLLMALQKWGEAKKVLFKAREIDQRNPEIRRALGWILAEQEKRDKEAVQFYHEAMELNPKFEVAVIEFAKIVLRSKQTQLYTLASYRLADLKKAGSKHEELDALLHNLNVLQKRQDQ